MFQGCDPYTKNEYNTKEKYINNKSFSLRFINCLILISLTFWIWPVPWDIGIKWGTAIRCVDESYCRSIVNPSTTQKTNTQTKQHIKFKFCLKVQVMLLQKWKISIQKTFAKSILYARHYCTSLERAAKALFRFLNHFISWDMCQWIAMLYLWFWRQKYKKVKGYFPTYKEIMSKGKVQMDTHKSVAHLCSPPKFL